MRLPCKHQRLSQIDRWFIPLFLCPVLAQAQPRPRAPSINQRPPRQSHRKLHILRHELQRHAIEQDSSPPLRSLQESPQASPPAPAPAALLHQLPWSCPGCGAYTQLVEPDEAGYYSLTRKSVRAHFKAQKQKAWLKETDGDVFAQEADPPGNQLQPPKSLPHNSSLEESPPHANSKEINETSPSPTPICNRCNTLLHHHSGVPIIHPTLQSLQDIFSESPHKYNHIYHVLDAADFPLSVIPHIHKHLALTPQRSHNRRSKTAKYAGGRRAELSFVITRSDLLAPKKEQVDTLMPYLVQVLRDALGPAGKDVRLGNVRCVSAKRGWWTKTLKDDILARGGGGWMIGKVNVGKSNLFEVVFPKGHGEDVDMHGLREEAVLTQEFSVVDDTTPPILPMLPPPQPFQPYPTMPIVSSLPGTTASPIRLPFANSKGELVDLPGLPRNDLSPYVLPAYQSSLVMQSRITARQFAIKPGQSLLLGGIIRVSLASIPHDSSCVLLAAPFVPLHAHVGLTEKMVGVQSQLIESGIESTASPNVGEKLASAGKFALEWDVTKARSGVLTDKRGIGLKANRLPYVVFSADVLVEGCGWVECTVQVRRRALENAKREEEGSERENAGNREQGVQAKEELAMEYGFVENKALIPGTPFVEVWSPEGKGIGIRRPMGAYMLGGEGSKPREQTSRPRRSMKGVKKRLKAEGRWKKAA